jgi:hypothetical protein
MKRPRKRLWKIKTISIPLIALAAVALVALSYIFLNENAIVPGITTTTTTIFKQQDCGDLQIDVNSVKEAVNYYRYGFQKPAQSNHKFVILNLTVTNKVGVAKDFSGYRINLLAGNSSYIPMIFNEIESITLTDNRVINYNCRESDLAYISRFELGAYESSTGCKIFQILSGSSPASISIYEVETLKCVINL